MRRSRFNACTKTEQEVRKALFGAYISTQKKYRGREKNWLREVRACIGGSLKTAVRRRGEVDSERGLVHTLHKELKKYELSSDYGAYKDNK